MLDRGLRKEVVECLEARIGDLRADYGIKAKDIEIRQALIGRGFQKRDIEALIARYRHSLLPRRATRVQLAQEARSITGTLMEAAAAIGKLSEETVDHIDLLALGRAKMFLRDVRKELHVLATAATVCGRKNQNRSLDAEMKGHAATLIAQTLREFGCNLDDRSDGLFMLALRHVFAALDLG